MSTAPHKGFRFKTFPEFDSDRLQFTGISEADADAIFNIRTNTQVNHFIERKQAKDHAAILEFIHYYKRLLESYCKK